MGSSLLLYIVLIFIAIIVFVFVAIAYVAAKRLLKPPRRIGRWNPRDLGYSYRDVEVTTRDGVRLRGWFIDMGSDATVLAIHGYTSSRWDEDYMKPVIRLLANNGFNVAAFDFRAHGESSGEYTTLGFSELRDYQDIIAWLKSTVPEKTRKLGVIGYSMGGAVAIMLSAVEERVDAVIADSPYMDIVASGKRWIKRMKSPLKYVLLAEYPLIVWIASRLAGVDIDALRVQRYASKVRKPLLIIAGTRDDLVSIEEIKAFYEEAQRAGRHIELWVTDSRHVRSIVDYPKDYEEKVVSFFRRWLG